MADDKTITLPVSGKPATIAGRGLTGRDTISAQRIAQREASDAAGGFVLLANLTTIDGRQLVYEDLLDMDARDIAALGDAVRGDERFPNAPGAAVTQTSPSR